MASRDIVEEITLCDLKKIKVNLLVYFYSTRKSDL